MGAKKKGETEKHEGPEVKEPFQIVGIGASAGGSEALAEFFSAVPSDTELAFLVVQHLSPDYKSLMVELLSKYTDMEVKRAEDGMPVEANHVYFAQDNLSAKFDGMPRSAGATGLVDYVLPPKLMEAGKAKVDAIRRRAEEIDVVLLDFHLPEMKGDEIARIIEGDARLKEIPVFLLTGHEKDELSDVSFGTNIREIITKPVDSRKLSEVFRGLESG